jgi:large subunit ribosomal protein L22
MKKLNLVCKLVRRAHVDSALLQLSLTPKKAARFVRAMIHQAKFNAAVQGMDPSKLIVDEIRIGRGTYLKRLEIKARGKTGSRWKPYCNMFVYVREIQQGDEFVYHHLKRRKPRWKSGRLKA